MGRSGMGVGGNFG
jgi:hypothetical protein